MFQLLHIDQAGKVYQAEQLVTELTWSGDILQCARALEYQLAQSERGQIPQASCDIGTKTILLLDGQTLFEGHIFSREKTTDSAKLNLSCWDWGYYLRRNQGTYQFAGQSPEQIARRVCQDFGIPVGRLAQTGFSLRRNFFGSSLYEIIQTAYTLASRQTGKQYFIRFQGRELEVLEKKTDETTLILKGGSNLIAATVSETVENMVNRVEVYDKDQRLVHTAGDGEAQRLYGVMQQVIRLTEGQSAVSQAQALLEEKGYQQKITVDNLGNPANLAGGAVVVQEPVTGLYGLFYIDSDRHQWKNGQYYNRLTLNFKSIMDEKEAGQLPNKTGSKTAPKKQSKKGGKKAATVVRMVSPTGEAY